MNMIMVMCLLLNIITAHIIILMVVMIMHIKSLFNTAVSTIPVLDNNGVLWAVSGTPI